MLYTTHLLLPLFSYLSSISVINKLVHNSTQNITSFNEIGLCIPLEIIKKTMTYLPANSNINLARTCHTYYKNLLKDDPQHVFYTSIPLENHFYLKAMVFYGKQSDRKSLQILVDHESKENHIIRKKLLDLYKNIEDHDEQDMKNEKATEKIIQICNDPDMIVNPYCNQTALYRAIHQAAIDKAHHKGNTIYKAHCEKIEILLRYFNANPHKKCGRCLDDHGDYSGLVCAIVDESTDIVQIILNEKNSCNINCEDLEIALYHAYESSKTAIVRMLLQHPLCNPNKIITTVVKRPKDILLLLTHAYQKINFNNRNSEGKTALEIIYEYIKNPKKYPYYWEYLPEEERQSILQQILEYQKNNPIPIIIPLHNTLSHIFQTMKNILKNIVTVVFTFRLY